VVPTYVVGMVWGYMWREDTGVINQILVDQLHLLSTRPFWLIGNNVFWAICIPTIWRSFPFTMIMLLSGLQTIPDELYEAAKIDGASPFQRFRFITMPMLKTVFSILIL